MPLSARLAAATLSLLFAGSAMGGEAPEPLIRIAPGLGPQAPEVRLDPDLAVRPLRSGFWLHASTDPDLGAANGVLAPLPGGGLLLVDTPWTDAQTERLLAWAAEHGGVRRAVVTHAHGDRMGGAGTLARLRIEVFAHRLTVEKVRAEGGELEASPLDLAPGTGAELGGFEVFYPGSGHTLDNVVVAFPAAGVVHGGCLIKSAHASGSGYVSESFLADWPIAVERVAERYPEADVVVPGHGTVGGRAAFDRTVEIVAAALATDRSGSARTIHLDVPADPDLRARWLIYLHGAIVERQGREAVSPDFGRYEYDAILAELAGRGFEVIAELRPPESGAAFEERLVGQVRRLREAGVPAERILVLGASKGGGLALEAAARLGHPGLSYVTLAGCWQTQQPLAPALRGRLLAIRDEPDRFQPDCGPLLAAANGLSAGRELVLHLGVDHGLIYRPLTAWLDAVESWARGGSGPE
jgi:glyoxylase-like metal-dependent hydrolase (beta-lactamase superfamily II)